MPREAAERAPNHVTENNHSGHAGEDLTLPTTRAGFPPTTANVGTSQSPTAPAPMIAPSPILEPARMTARVPIQTFSPMEMFPRPVHVGGCGVEVPGEGGTGTGESVITTSWAMNE